MLVAKFRKGETIHTTTVGPLGFVRFFSHLDDQPQLNKVFVLTTAISHTFVQGSRGRMDGNTMGNGGECHVLNSQQLKQL